MLNKKQYLINSQIIENTSIEELLLLNNDYSILYKKIELKNALELAKKKNLDIILINIDKNNNKFGTAILYIYEKYLYQKKKDQKTNKSSNKQSKEIFLSAKSSLADISRSLNKIVSLIYQDNINTIVTIRGKHGEFLNRDQYVEHYLMKNNIKIQLIDQKNKSLIKFSTIKLLNSNEIYLINNIKEVYNFLILESHKFEHNFIFLFIFKIITFIWANWGIFIYFINRKYFVKQNIKNINSKNLK